MRPALIDSMSLAMAEVYESVTDRILVNMAKYFPYRYDPESVAGAQRLGAFEYQARMLAQMGKVSRETADIIANSLTGADAKLRESLEKAIVEALRTEEPKLRKAAEKGLLYGEGAVQPQLSPNQMNAFRTYYRQSADKLNLVNTVMLESTQAAYTATVSDVVNRIERTQSILNTATGEVVTGVSSWNQAMRGAVDRMISNGLTGFIDHGGHHWSPEAYVAMDIRTTMFNTARAAIWELNESYGNDLYQVSSHNGARPLCYPWQGKVISRSDAVREVEDLDGNRIHVYAQSETSYGEAAGLFGVNCKHYPMTFIPGVSTIKGEPQDPEENEKSYELSQQQRGLERKLRDEKLKLNALKAQGAPESEIRGQQAKVAQASDDIRVFCDETGRTRRRSREAVLTNASFPDKDSYDPITFPTEQRDRITEFFNSSKSTPPEQTTLLSPADYDAEISRLRARRAELFQRDNYDKAETDRLLEQIMSLENEKADYVQAYTVAGGDTRLTNMLRSDDPRQVVGAVDEILNSDEYALPASHWNGDARVRPKDAEDMRQIAGKAYLYDDIKAGAKDGSIDIRQDYLHEYSTVIHEDLHQRSRGDLSTYDLMYVLRNYRALEEGTVQLMTEEVCKKMGYNSRKTYTEKVDALRDLHPILAPRKDDYAYAKDLIDRTPIARYNYVMDGIQAYRDAHPNMRPAVRDKIANAESKLKKGAPAK